MKQENKGGLVYHSGCYTPTWQHIHVLAFFIFLAHQGCQCLAKHQMQGHQLEDKGHQKDEFKPQRIAYANICKAGPTGWRGDGWNISWAFFFQIEHIWQWHVRHAATQVNCSCDLRVSQNVPKFKYCWKDLKRVADEIIEGLLIEIIEDSRIVRRSSLSGSEWSNRNQFGNVWHVPGSLVFAVSKDCWLFCRPSWPLHCRELGEGYLVWGSGSELLDFLRQYWKWCRICKVVSTKCPQFHSKSNTFDSGGALRFLSLLSIRTIISIIQ